MAKAKGLTPAQWVKARKAGLLGNDGSTLEPQPSTDTPTTNGDVARNATTGSDPTTSKPQPKDNDAEEQIGLREQEA
jgi:hypothetical protein